MYRSWIRTLWVYTLLMAISTFTLSTLAAWVWWAHLSNDVHTGNGTMGIPILPLSGNSLGVQVQTPQIDSQATKDLERDRAESNERER
jgi:hypothetical protein